MMRYLVVVFSVMFALNAMFSALWLTVDQRGANLITFSVAPQAEASVLAQLSGQQLPDELVHANADLDSPTEHLIGVLSFDALEGAPKQLPAVTWVQMRVLSDSYLVAAVLPWTYLKGPMRPPRQQA